MITIAKPREYIDKLWGKQKIREGEIYRLMRYVLRVDHEDKVLLQNVVTGRLVVLEREEAEALETLPAAYSPVMEQLVTEHYLVPESYDEHQQVISLRRILQKLEDARRKKSIIHYTILPTTACNARCYYCFEGGCEHTTMSAKTADEVVEYIAQQAGSSEKVHITWFGGEPTVASNRIDQISEGLKAKGISFYSDMNTNGYLFDERLVQKAKSIWNLKYLQICFDGVGAKHNHTKNYVNVQDDPYERTLRNIGMLMEQGIRVGIRMNFDLANCDDFELLIKEANERFSGSQLFSVYAFPVLGEYADREGNILHGTNDWFKTKIVELNSLSRANGTFWESRSLPHLKYHCCAAENEAAVAITPEGELVKCCQCFGKEEVIGDVRNGVLDSSLKESWKQSADYEKCKECSYGPNCYRIEKCPAKDRCLFRDEWLLRDKLIMERTYQKWSLGNRKKEMDEYVASGTQSRIC